MEVLQREKIASSLGQDMVISRAGQRGFLESRPFKVARCETRKQENGDFQKQGT